MATKSVKSSAKAKTAVSRGGEKSVATKKLPVVGAKKRSTAKKKSTAGAKSNIVAAESKKKSAKSVKISSVKTTSGAKREVQRLANGKTIVRVGGRVLHPAKKIKPDFKRVPLRIVRKPAPAPARPQVVQKPTFDTAKGVAFAMSIAREMKRAAVTVEKSSANDGIRLTRRPTTRTQGSQTEKFPAADLKDFRRRLLDARARALSGVTAIKSDGFNSEDDHEADGGDGTAQTLRLQALGQMGSINRTIQQIDEALHRIDDGTYGVCTACGQLIRKPRLLNQPFVLMCMECQAEMEREAGR